MNIFGEHRVNDEQKHLNGGHIDDQCLDRVRIMDDNVRFHGREVPLLDGLLFLLRKADLVVNEVVFALGEPLEADKLHVFHIFDLFEHNVGNRYVAFVTDRAIARSRVDRVTN